MTNNIVTAVFGAFREAKTRKLWQWDYGMKLVFTGLDLPDTYTVHQANEPLSGNAKTRIGDASGVDILDEYLTTGKNVYVWLYLHTGESDGETVYMVTIPVQARPRPTEDEPTPVQQGLIDQAIVALNAGVEQTGRDVISTGESAAAAAASERNAEAAQTASEGARDRAEAAAGNAETSESNARTYAGTAANKASEAAASAQAAAGSALNASDSAGAAAGSATTATTKAGEAANSATAAAGSATTASNKAGDAAASAQAAEDSATLAGTKAGEAAASAQEAAGSAEASSGSASTASEKADEAAASAEAAADSAIEAASATDRAEEAAARLDRVRSDLDNLRFVALADSMQQNAAINKNAQDIATNTQDIETSVANLAAFEGSIAPREATSTASRAYAVGALLVLNNAVYIVTSPIASGETIAPGSNCTATTIDANLLRIDTSLTATGKAADAKATGDLIRALSAEIADMSNNMKRMQADLVRWQFASLAESMILRASISA